MGLSERRSERTGVDKDDGLDRREKLLRILDEAERAAAAVKAKAQDVLESAAYSEGLVQRLRPVVKDLPDDSVVPAETWQDLTDAWHTHTLQLGSIFKVVGSDEPLFFATGSVASLTTATSSILLSNSVAKPNPSLDALNSYLVRASLLDEVRKALESLGLDRSPAGSRSPLALLDEAAAAIKRPSSSQLAPASALLPVREAVQAAVTALLPRRPEQEPTGKWVDKVMSIGRQCGLDGLRIEHFERLGRVLASLVIQLSAAKQRSFSATEVSREFDAALKFLKAFLISLDDSKLRPA